MTQETRCPACGAPLVITGLKAPVQCTFCGADLSIEDESGEANFRVVNQPEPQKEILSKPVEGHGGPTGAAQVYGESGIGDVSSTRAADEPVRSAMQFNSAGPTFEPQVVSPGAAVYTASPERKGLSGAKRWWVIGGAVLLGLILLCACLVAVVLAVAPNLNF